MKKYFKRWLIIFLFILPFQHFLSKFFLKFNPPLSQFISFLDEITIVIFLPFLLINIWENKKNKNYQILTLILGLIAVMGIISGIVNRNPVLPTLLGIFDYIKNFLVIFIYAYFFKDIRENKKIFQHLSFLALVIAGIAIGQEIFLQFGIFEADFVHNLIYSDQTLYRFGIYRVSSLIGHPNLMGLFLLLILIMELSLNQEKTEKSFIYKFILYFCGIIISVSRMVIAGFTVLGIYFCKKKKWLILPVILTLTMTILMTFNITFKQELVRKTPEISTQEEENPDFRNYSFKKSIEIWRENPLFGIGPGMYGGVISFVFPSPVYKEYDFSAHWYDYMKNFRSLDQFWPQALAEIGLVGTILFALLIVSIFFVFWKERKISNFLEGIALSSLIIFFYTLGSGLNMTIFLFTFSALAGMGLAIIGKDNESSLNQ